MHLLQLLLVSLTGAALLVVWRKVSYPAVQLGCVSQLHKQVVTPNMLSMLCVCLLVCLCLQGWAVQQVSTSIRISTHSAFASQAT